MVISMAGKQLMSRILGLSKRSGVFGRKYLFDRILSPQRRLGFTASLSSAVNKMLVESETIGHVYLVGINRPEKRNCVNQAVASHLIDAFEHFEKNDDLYVAVLYGKGGNFCAGYDLEELSENSMSVDIPDLTNITRGPMGPTRMQFKKPVIAAVSGYAVAGGIELACMCDLRVVEESAILGVFCRRFGVPLVDGGTVRLPQLIGLSRALDLILTGRPVPAKEALEMGLANRVVPNGSALGEATKLAQSLCHFPQECLRSDRLSAFYSCFSATSLQDAFNFEWNNSKHIINQESVDGAKKFIGGVGRKGDFDGKSKL